MTPMRISLLNIIRITSLICLVASFILTPKLAASLLSSDGVLESHTVTEIQVWRLLAVVCGLTLLFASLVWNWMRQSELRLAIESDYANWSDPLKQLNSQDRKWMRAATLALWAAVGLVLLTIYISFHYADTSWFSILAWENGVIESIQAGCLLVAGVLLMPMALRDWRRDGKFFSAIGLFFGFLLIVAAGEEISWGQHWIGFETPEALMETNVQGEFNFHNIGSYWINNLLTLFFLAYFGIRPVFEHFYPQLRYVLDRMSMPAAPLLLVPVAFVSVLLDDNDVIMGFWQHPAWRLSEGRELLFGVSMLVVTLLMRRYRSHQAANSL